MGRPTELTTVKADQTKYTADFTVSATRCGSEWMVDGGERFSVRSGNVLASRNQQRWLTTRDSRMLASVPSAGGEDDFDHAVKACTFPVDQQ
jgi:hypothetical protein